MRRHVGTAVGHAVRRWKRTHGGTVATARKIHNGGVQCGGGGIKGLSASKEGVHAHIKPQTLTTSSKEIIHAETRHGTAALHEGIRSHGLLHQGSRRTGGHGCDIAVWKRKRGMLLLPAWRRRTGERTRRRRRSRPLLILLLRCCGRVCIRCWLLLLLGGRSRLRVGASDRHTTRIGRLLFGRRSPLQVFRSCLLVL